MRYIITQNGFPHFDNALELPCTDKDKAVVEAERLTKLQHERNNRPRATGRGSAFLNMQTDWVYAVKEIL